MIHQNQSISLFMNRDEVNISLAASNNVGDLFKIDNLNYVITSIQPNEVMIFKNHSNYFSSFLKIPEYIKINGEIFQVTNIADEAFAEYKNLESVIIPSSIKKIGKYAFIGCKNLEKLFIPNSVKHIGKGAFFYCSKLACIVSKIKNPKEILYEDFIFSLTPADCNLFIPYDCLAEYKQSVWNNFSKIEEIYIGT